MIQREQPLRNWEEPPEPSGPVEECFEEAKGQVGLDQDEVRRRDGWRRHITPRDAGAGISVRDPASDNGPLCRRHRQLSYTRSDL